MPSQLAEGTRRCFFLSFARPIHRLQVVVVVVSEEEEEEEEQEEEEEEEKEV